MLKRTPLFEAHQKLGGRLVEFGGWEMPVQYTSIIEEHQAVRQAAGIFDISHMGELMIGGAQAEIFLNHVLTNDIRKLAPGQGQYTLMCRETGGVIDDLYAYRLDVTDFMLIVNASRIEADFAWLEKQHAIFPGRAEVELKNASEDFGAVAIQGPRAAEFMNRLFRGPSQAASHVLQVTDLKKNQFSEWLWGESEGGAEIAYVSRTGYTGEDGFEIIVARADVETLWNRALEAGRDTGLKPCGLGARDTLRTEVGYPLYGHELDENTTPIEAGVGFFVALEKNDFIGRAALAAQKVDGVTKKCVAFKMTDKSAPPRPHYPIWSTGLNSIQIGEVVSGTQSPSLGIGIGMGYVKPEFAKAQTQIEIEIRGKRAMAMIVPKPIYKK